MPRPGPCCGDPTLTWPSGQVGLLDLSLRRTPADAFVVSDLDEGGWLEDFAMPDPTLAPAGCSAVQIQLPLPDGEDRAVTVARLERLADVGLPGWRDRVVHRRDAVARGRTGAVDYPGTTWRDRPAVERGDGAVPGRRPGGGAGPAQRGQLHQRRTRGTARRGEVPGEPTGREPEER